MRRTPMKRTGFSRKEQPAHIERAPAAIKLVAKPTRRAVMAPANDAVFAQPKTEMARCEAYRRLVALFPCALCGIEGYSQAAHPNTGKGLSMKTDDRLCFPLCAPRPGVRGCHGLFDQGALMTKDERRTFEPQAGAQTRAKITDLGLWPATLANWIETETPMIECTTAAELDQDSEQDDSPVVHVLVSAEGLAIPAQAASCPTSIFELAGKPVKVNLSKSTEPSSACYAHLSVASGVTVVAGAAYPARWTEADHEREAERRQRQRPPRPTRAAKTKSAKLRDLIGDDDEK
jgi:hypothetical protein